MRQNVGRKRADPGALPSARLAVKLNDRLRDLGSNLTAMITEMNKLTGNASGSLTFGGAEDDDGTTPSDSLSQIMAILNAHLSSLEWINNSTEDIEAKVAQLEKQMENSQDAAAGSVLGASALGRSGMRRPASGLGSSRYR